jgi:hypothetical protein
MWPLALAVCCMSMCNASKQASPETIHGARSLWGTMATQQLRVGCVSSERCGFLNDVTLCALSNVQSIKKVTLNFKCKTTKRKVRRLKKTKKLTNGNHAIQEERSMTLLHCFNQYVELMFEHLRPNWRRKSKIKWIFKKCVGRALSAFISPRIVTSGNELSGYIKFIKCVDYSDPWG